MQIPAPAWCLGGPRWMPGVENRCKCPDEHASQNTPAAALRNLQYSDLKTGPYHVISARLYVYIEVLIGWTFPGFAGIQSSRGYWSTADAQTGDEIFPCLCAKKVFLTQLF